MKNIMFGFVFIMFICTLAACLAPPAGKGVVQSNEQVRMILDQIGELQTSEEALVKEMLQRPRIFDDENLRGFPQNRSQLEMIATQQIGTLEKIIELKEAQILKVNEIAALPVEKPFRDIADNTSRSFEKSLEMRRLDVQTFRLILDPNITVREDLEARNLPFENRRKEIDREAEALEKERLEIKRPENR